MKGRLEFSSDNQVFVPVGSLRPAREQSYTVTPQTLENRLGDPEAAALKVEAVATCITLNASFLSQDSWYFRIHFPAENKHILLSARSYTVEYDAQPERQEIGLYVVKVEFLTTVANLITYSVPYDILPSEDAVVLEDSPIYIE